MDIRKFRKAAKAQGWEIDRTKKGHERFTRRGQVCIFSGTPSDQRAIKNFLSQLRRAGFIWPWPPPKSKRS